MDPKKYAQALREGQEALDRIRKLLFYSGLEVEYEALLHSLKAYQELLHAIPFALFGFDLPYKIFAVMDRLGVTSVGDIKKVEQKILDQDGQLVQDINSILKAFNISPLGEK